MKHRMVFEYTVPDHSRANWSEPPPSPGDAARAVEGFIAEHDGFEECRLQFVSSEEVVDE